MFRSILFLVIAVLQPLAGGFSNFTGLGQSIGARAREDGIPPELPPGIFFSIWSVIFLLYAACAVMSFRAKPGSALDRAGVPLIVAGLGNMSWMLSSQLIGSRALDLVLILALLGVSLWALRRGQGGERSLLVDAETGLLAGWLTAASAISFAPVGRLILDHGVTDAVWGYSALTAAAAFAGFLLCWQVVARNVFYLVALGWGLAGLALNNLERTGLDLIGWTFAALILLVLVVSRPDRLIGAKA
jgi:tryptophan-rich sensory protein